MTPARGVLTDIGQLLTATGNPGGGEASLGLAVNQALAWDGEVITHIGSVGEPWVEELGQSGVPVFSAEGRVVMPGFVDSHTHLVFGGDRVEEFTARMSGETYSAGGIQTTVRATREASEDELHTRASQLAREALRQGTTTLEIKTGYGLDVETELRLAKVARDITDQVTFLGAHVVAPEYADNPDRYVDLVCGEMLDAVRPFARFIDVFLEQGAFSASQATRILEAGVAQGLLPTLHASQLGPGRGAEIASEVGAISLSHGTYLEDRDLDLLATSKTVLTYLPATEFATKQPYPDASRALSRGIAVALASNCNPGSGFSSSMPFVVALAVREMGMSPADAVWSATAGGAAALRLTDRGVLRVGARADFIEVNAPHYAYLAYRPGVPLVRRVWRGGLLEADNS